MTRTVSSFASRCAATAALLLATAGTLGAQGQEYPQSLYWGTGLIDIPVAPVMPITGDFAFSYSGKSFEEDQTEPKLNYNNTINSQLTFSMSFIGRFEVGVAAYSSNPEQGFFGRGVLLRQEDFAARGGFARFVPSVALGVRNVGPYEHIDRFGIGYKLLPPNAEDPDAKHLASEVHQKFNTANTVYGVATSGFSLADIRPNWPDVNLSVTVGYGNGLFQEDGDLGERYASHATGGLFYGVKTDFSPGKNLVLSLMAENNAWDYNLGGSLYWRGLRAGLYLTEVGASRAGQGAGEDSLPESLYGYSKMAFKIGWQSNMFALLRGNFLQNRAAELEKQRAELLAQIASRQQRIAALELEINRYEAQNLLELEQRRAQAEAELREEREALRRLEDRLRRIEQQNQGTTPPGGTPPTTTPPAGTTTPPVWR